MTAVLAQEAREVMASADRLYTLDDIELALDRMAAQITARLARANPLFVAVMKGAIPVAGALLQRLNFPLEVEYVHATRYGDQISGAQLQWLREPEGRLAGRTILIVDDILDEGITMKAITKRYMELGAISVVTAVLCTKSGVQRQIMADYSALTVPDRYVFGYGMDYRGYLRNTPGIYAVQAKD